MGKTIAEKIFESHIIDQPAEETFVIKLDAVFCHEITTPTAILDLMERKMEKVFDPDKIKAVIDHISPAKDSETAKQGLILRNWSKKHKIKDFFDIGRNGVCHALFPEKGFVRPGFTIIMGDSHTCTHGAFGAFAAGVGTTDLAVGIHKGVCRFQKPKTIKIEIKGNLKKGVYSKDVILSIIKLLGVNGATGKVIEFTGTVVDNMSMEERMTLCNMAIEAGGTSGICYPDIKTATYLWEFIKDKYGSPKDAAADFSKLISDNDATYDKIIVHDISDLVPLSTFGYKPDQVKPITELEGTKIDQAYIGSCTNGRIEDLRIAASVLEGKKIADSVRGIVSPATPNIYKQALKEGIIDIFMESGFCVTNPTCGACLGMSNGVLAEGEVCASTTNRNFNGRMGNGGMVHLMSPASTAASAIKGYITNSKLYEEGGNK